MWSPGDNCSTTIGVFPTGLPSSTTVAPDGEEVMERDPDFGAGVSAGFAGSGAAAPAGAVSSGGALSAAAGTSVSANAQVAAIRKTAVRTPFLITIPLYLKCLPPTIAKWGKTGGGKKEKNGGKGRGRGNPPFFILALLRVVKDNTLYIASAL